MTPTEHDDGDRGPTSQFAKSRARALRERTDHRDRAVRTVAGQARDVDEFTGLLSMLGLDNEQGGSPALSQALARYVGQVAAAVGVPADAVGYEVSDTATAYLGLAARLPAHTGRNLTLVWDERLGWYVGVETHPDETPLVICYFGGEAVPPVAAVARFVVDAVAGHRAGRLRPVPTTARPHHAGQADGRAHEVVATGPEAAHVPGQDGGAYGGPLLEPICVINFKVCWISRKTRWPRHGL